jgi:hypothetical protein
LLAVLLAVHALIKFACIQVQINRKCFQVFHSESAPVFACLVVEQQIVILPEGTLVCGAFAGLRGPD